MGNTHYKERYALMLGLQYSGKTMFSNYVFDRHIFDYLETHGSNETLITYTHKKIHLIEFGGTIAHLWCKLFKENKHREHITCILLFIDGSFNIQQLERTRSHLMHLYYDFHVDLSSKPLCIVQHNISADNAPLTSWSNIKKSLQLDLLLESHYCNDNILMIRLVYDEPDALSKNTDRILEWIISL